MRLTLERMHMENFKGINDLTIDFSETRTRIQGMNGTGKTTIVDAFCWVLFNQNAAGDAPGSDNFREKPLDAQGQIIHNLETTVELFCVLDGQRFDLKRTQTENWVKKRGNAEATFQGNISTYWINGVETKQADFKQRIKAIADDEVFRLVGSLSAFNHLEWKKRRAQLLALADSDIDGVLLATDEYRPVADEVGRRNISVDDLRKVLADQCKAIKNELKMLPVRIDEAKKSLPQFGPTEVHDAEYMLAEVQRSVEEVDRQISEARANSGQAAVQSQILTLEQEIISCKRRIMDDFEAEKRGLKRKFSEAQDELNCKTANLNDAKRKLERLKAEHARAVSNTDSLREQFLAVKREQVAVDTTCPTCGQTLPAEMVQAATEKLQADRKRRMQEIKTKGVAASLEVSEISESVAKADAEVKLIESSVEAAEAAKQAAFDAMGIYPAEPDFTGNTALQDLIAQLDALRQNQNTSADQKIRQLTERKQELLAVADKQRQTLARRDSATETEQRIKMHEQRQRELGAQLSETEILTALVEQFITDRCGALEDSINSHFPTVRWKLFDTQINGGIVDVCTCMIECDGAMVPYNSANTASQINADVEIVNVLSDKYDIRVPLFLDNAERLVTIPDVHTQLISLSVAPCKLTADGMSRITAVGLI